VEEEEEEEQVVVKVQVRTGRRWEAARYVTVARWGGGPWGVAVQKRWCEFWSGERQWQQRSNVVIVIASLQGETINEGMHACGMEASWF